MKQEDHKQVLRSDGDGYGGSGMGVISVVENISYEEKQISLVGNELV